MAWEDRSGRRYYYRKCRRGGRVVSEYVGSGFAGEIAEILDAEDKLEAEQKRAAVREQKASAARLDGKTREIERFTKAMTRAILLLSGYHAPNRQWRKRRNG
jgi:hypothetical protein